MDPASAIGLAANVLQFIEYGIQLFSESRELASSSSGATTANTEIENIAQKLSILASHLANRKPKPRSNANATLTSLGQSTSGNNDNENHEERIREAIVDIAEDCRRLSSELINAIPRLTESSKGSKWKSFLCALRTLWSEKKVHGLKEKLFIAEGTLKTHILTLMRYGSTPLQPFIWEYSQISA